MSYQVNVYQKQPNRFLFAEHLCNDPNFRSALLCIVDAGYSHLFIPGTWGENSKLNSIAQQLRGADNFLMAYAKSPKQRHFEPERVRSIARALAVVAEAVNAQP